MVLMTKNTVCIDVYGDKEMKKKLFLITTILFIVSLCGCNGVSNIHKIGTDSFAYDELKNYKEFKNYLQNLNIEHEKSENFVIYTDENQTGYIYTITNNYGEQIDFGYHNYRGSFDIYEKSGLLVLDYGFGGNSWQERFYDVERGKVSRFFQNPLATYNENIAYFTIKPENQEIYLIIQNIFDSSLYYEEILWEYSSNVFRTQPQTQFIQNGTKLKISYYEETNNELITQIINLE